MSKPFRIPTATEMNDEEVIEITFTLNRSELFRLESAIDADRRQNSGLDEDDYRRIDNDALRTQIVETKAERGIMDSWGFGA